MRIPMLIVLLSALTACAGSIPFSEPPRVDPPPPSALEACRRPASLPVGGLTQAEGELRWLQDRRRLVDCASRHEALVLWITDLGMALK